MRVTVTGQSRLCHDVQKCSFVDKGTPWRKGSASDSSPEGCAFKSRRGHLFFSCKSPPIPVLPRTGEYVRAIMKVNPKDRLACQPTTLGPRQVSPGPAASTLQCHDACAPMLDDIYLLREFFGVSFYPPSIEPGAFFSVIPTLCRVQTPESRADGRCITLSTGILGILRWNGISDEFSDTTHSLFLGLLY